MLVLRMFEIRAGGSAEYSDLDHPERGGSMLFWTIGNHLRDNMASQPEDTSLNIRSLHPGKDPGTHWIGGWVDLRAGPDTLEEESLPLLGI
jgi:hypothetical protein